MLILGNYLIGIFRLHQGCLTTDVIDISRFYHGSLETGVDFGKVSIKETFLGCTRV